MMGIDVGVRVGSGVGYSKGVIKLKSQYIFFYGTVPQMKDL